MSGFCSLPVECRAEGRADQRPVRFFWQGAWLQVEAIQATWHERGLDPVDPGWRAFRVVSRGGLFELRVQEAGWVWLGRKIPIAPESDR